MRCYLVEMEVSITEAELPGFRSLEVERQVMVFGEANGTVNLMG